MNEKRKRKEKRQERKEREERQRYTGFSDLSDSIINDSGPRMADKRQLNLNHEYERTERVREQREEERVSDRRGETT